MKKGLRAFTLVELLAVIAVISVLAALLLPTMELALEQSRRTVCAGNHRQLYLSVSCYASDWNDRMPYQAITWTLGNVIDGGLYWVPAQAPMRHFLRNYAGLDIPLDAATGLGLPKKGGIAYCPSRWPTAAPSYNTINYGFPVFGTFHSGNVPGSMTVATIGTTRFSKASQPGPYPADTYPFWKGAPVVAPTAVITDTTARFEWDGPTRLGFNHDLQGGNATVGDGATRWLSTEYWNGPTQGYCYVPAGQYYAQFDRGGVWYPNDGYLAGMCAALYRRLGYKAL